MLTGVDETSDKFSVGVVDSGNQPCVANISVIFRNFSKDENEKSGAWDKLIQEKNLKLKIMCDSPFKTQNLCVMSYIFLILMIPILMKQGEQGHTNFKLNQLTGLHGESSH
jgi:hypothetical protein